MLLRVVLFALSPFILFAQYSELAASHDGSVVYFSTAMRQKGTDQPFHLKLFKFVQQGLAPVVVREEGNSIGWTVDNFYMIGGAEVGTDPSVLAYNATRHCNGGSGCLKIERSQGQVGAHEFTGRVTISPNGRYAYNYLFSTFIAPGRGQLIDLTTGERTAVNVTLPAPQRRIIADNGTILLCAGATAQLWKNGRIQTVQSSVGPVVRCQINAAATTAIFLTGANQLVSHDLSSNAETVLASYVAPLLFSSSTDGSRILYLRSEIEGNLQAFIAPGDRQLLSVPEGLTDAVLSGDGKTAYAATAAGRLLRIHVDSGDVEELIGRTPYVYSDYNYTAFEPRLSYDLRTTPGSAVTLRGTALDAATGVTVNGQSVPVLASDSGAVTFQVPWDAPPTGPTPFRVDPGNSLFEAGPGSIHLSTFAPMFFTVSNAASGFRFEVLAAHQDFASLVDAQNPAKGGEVVHLWLTGLGPVDQPPAAAQPSPVSPLARITSPLRCQFWDGGPNDAEILFAGLAPGLIGVYQLDLRVPQGLRLSSPTVACTSGTEDSIGAFGTLPVAQ